MAEIKRNGEGKVLFSTFKKAVNAESLDELDGYTCEVWTTRGPCLPAMIHMDPDKKAVVIELEKFPADGEDDARIDGSGDPLAGDD